MKCPICGNNAYVEYDAYGNCPMFRCPLLMSLEPNNKEVSHYEKYETGWEGTSAYEEHIIALPYKVVNHYVNDGLRRPYSVIYKYVIKNGKWGPYGNFDEVTRLEMILEALPYKKMQNRLKTLILLS
jgi:hypothetical protein